MFLTPRTGVLRVVLSQFPLVSRITTSSGTHSSHPNKPLDLDPGLQALLNDVDISLMHHKTLHHPPPLRELEALPTDLSSPENGTIYSEATSEEITDNETRKSPAALFGSQRIGAVSLPSELQRSITLMIAGGYPVPSDHSAMLTCVFRFGQTNATQ